MPAVKRITSWSFSRYAAYSQCPQKAKYTFIDKLPEPKNAAMDRGNKVHKDAEDFVKGTLARVPPELKGVAGDLKRLKKLYKDRLKLGLKGMAPAIEETWSFRADWTQTTWNDWSGCWLRIKLDVAWWETDVCLVVDDWKTGKYSEASNQQYLEQLELYALGAFLTYPQCEVVKPRLRYVDQDLTYPPDNDPIVYTRAQLPMLLKTWGKRVKAMLGDAKFAPRPGWYCAGCYFNKSTLVGWGKNQVAKPVGPCKY